MNILKPNTFSFSLGEERPAYKAFLQLFARSNIYTNTLLLTPSMASNKNI